MVFFSHSVNDKCIRPLAEWFIFASLVMMDSVLTEAIILCVIWILMERDKLTIGLCHVAVRITFGEEFHLEPLPDQSNHHQLGLFL
jgi:hypothetical protein